MILVTGAGGHLGANLVRRLLADGLRVRAMLHTQRDRASVEGLAVDVVVGDLRDASAAAAAVQNCRQVYHCAAQVSTTYGGRDIFGANVLATRNVLAEAQAAGVEKVVVTGSFSAVGIRADRPSNEDDPFDPLLSHLPYGFTKAAAEHECLKAFANGMPVVIAVSTAIVGPFDFKPSRMGQVLIRFAAGKLHGYVPGGFPFVAAADIVQGHVLAMNKGRPGQKYIFSTSFMTFDELLTIFSSVTGRKPPPLRIPPGLMSVVAKVAGSVMPYLAPGSEQLLTPGAIQLLRMGRQADTGKAERELGFRPTDIRTAIEEAYTWFVTRGVIAPRDAVTRSSQI